MISPANAQITFRQACARYATGITISTAIASDGTPHGFTANSFTSVSLEPPLVLICIDRKANIIDLFRTAKYFGINVLEASQQELSNRFAGRGQDRFESVNWNPGSHGVPLLEGALAHFECRLENVIEAGDHDIFIGEVLRSEFSDGDPLLYFKSRYGEISSAE